MSDTSCKWIKTGGDWWEICADGPFEGPESRREEPSPPLPNDTLPGLDDPNEVTVYGFRNPEDRYITMTQCQAMIDNTVKELKKKKLGMVETPAEKSIWQKIIEALSTIRR